MDAQLTEKQIRAQEKRKAQERIRAENIRRKKAERKAFEDAILERVGFRLYRYWMSLDPVRQQEQIQIWDKEDAELARKEAEERKRVEAEEEIKRQTHTYPSGAKYIGGSIKDPDGGTVTPHGFGTYWWSNGQKMYEGHWRKGLKEGHGTYYWLNGNSWTGMFGGDAMNGYGVYRKPGGTERGCIYQNGRRTGWMEDLELGARVQIQSTGTQWLSATVIKILPNTKRLVRYDRKNNTEELVDFAVRRFRFHKLRQANTYRMDDIRAADANPKWQKLAVREQVTMTPRQVKEERAAAEAEARAKAEATSSDDDEPALRGRRRFSGSAMSDDY